MNPLFRLLMGGAVATAPPPPTGDTPMILGVNLGSVFYYNPEPIFVDLLKQGYMTRNGTNIYATVDANGYPNEDFFFSYQRLPPDSPLNQTITILIDGNPGAVTVTNFNFWTLGPVNYTPSTDTATITITGPSDASQLFEGCQLKLVGTKKTTTSPTGTGVRRIRIPRPGYESRPDQVITDEFIEHMRPFKSIRFVKAMGTEVTTNMQRWSDYPRLSNTRAYGGEDHGVMPIEDIIDICNAVQANPWLNIPGSAIASPADTSVEYGMAQYVDANLDPSLFATYEAVNETWNYGAYRWFGWGSNVGLQEIYGFWVDNFERATTVLLTAQRTNNVLTLGLNYSHGMTSDQTYRCSIQGRVGTGDVTAHPTDATHFTIPDAGPSCKIAVTCGTQSYVFGDARIGGTRSSGVVTAYCRFPHGFTTGDTVYVPLSGLTSGTKIFTITVTDSTHFTFADAGGDTGLLLTDSGSPWGGSMSSGSPLTYDGFDPVGSQFFSEKYWTRRKVQMSDNIRSAVGSSKMMTRHRPVYMTQWAGPGTIFRFYDAKGMIEGGLGTTYRAKFYAIGGGGYPDGTDSSGDRHIQDSNTSYTKAQFLVDYADSTLYGHHDNDPTSMFSPDLFKSFALSEGVKQYMYECGIDSRIYSNGPSKANNAQQVRLAFLDPAWKQIEKNFPTQQAQLGTDLANMFNAEMVSATDYSGGGNWGLFVGLHTTTPKQQAFLDLAASPPPLSRNLAPGIVDARYPIAFYDWNGGGLGFNYSGPYPTMADPWAAYPMPKGRWRYVVSGTEARTMQMTINYKTLIAVPHTITLIQNGQTIGTINVPSVGVGNMGSTAPVSLSIVFGPNNGIDLLRDFSNSDFEIHSMTFT